MSNMATDITELAQSLKAAAEKATPGRWEYYPGNTSIEYNVDSMDEDQGSIVYVDSGDFTQAQTDRNGEFIAMANPASILALVEALEKAQAENTAGVAGMAESYETTISMLRSRIAELEESHAQVIQSRDHYKRISEEGLKQLAESRTVKLPPTFWYEHDDLSRDVPVLDKRLVKKMLREAGIKVEAE